MTTINNSTPVLDPEEMLPEESYDFPADLANPELQANLEAALSQSDEDEEPEPPDDLAALVQLEPEEEEEIPKPSASDEAEFTGELEEDDEEFVDPRTQGTKRTIVNSPYSRVALIGGGTLVATLIGIAGYNLLNNAAGQKSAIVATSPSPTAIDPNAPNAQASAETAKYKTEAALAKQGESTALINGKKPAPTPSPTASPSATSNSSPTAPPLPVVAPLPANPSPAMSSPPDVPQIAAISGNARDNLAAITPPSAFSQWQAAATLGSYGQVSGKAYSAYPTPTTNAPSAPSSTVPRYDSSSGGSSSSGLSGLRSSSSISGLRDRPLAPVLIGTTARGSLATAIVIGQDGSNSGDAKYLIKLNSALKDTQGATAIPQGAVLVATISGFGSGTGAINLKVGSVIVNDREYSAPDGAIVVRSPNGSALIADKHQPGNSGFLGGVLPALFAGLAQVGQTINTPTSSSVTSTGGISTTSTNAKSDVSAAFLSGAFGNLSQRLSQQAQNANQNVAQQGQTTYSLPAGKEVQVFVNSTFEM